MSHKPKNQTREGSFADEAGYGVGLLILGVTTCVVWVLELPKRLLGKKKR